jgi:hypothetical protein
MQRSITACDSFTEIGGYCLGAYGGNSRRQYFTERKIYATIFMFLCMCFSRHMAQPIVQFIVPIATKSYFIDKLQDVLLYPSQSDIYEPTIVHPPNINSHMLTREMRRTILASDGNQMIHERLCSGEKFIAGRGGDSELLIVEDVINGVTPQVRGWPRRHSGIYPETPESLQVFGDTYYEAMRSLRAPDLFAFFQHRTTVEDVVLPFTLAKSVSLIHEDALSPFFFPSGPWSECLRNKTVLIVHPFVESIRCQLRRRDLLFPHSPDTLPPFNVKFVKSFQCMGEQPLPHRDWNETMHATMRLVDAAGHFDVALIAAGSYGLPLAVYCKTVKRASAIVAGGSLQMLFGLRGMRWDRLYPTGFKPGLSSTVNRLTTSTKTLFNNTKHSDTEVGVETTPSLYNSNWMYPLRQDNVINPEKIEHGSPYWGPPGMQLEECPV